MLYIEDFNTHLYTEIINVISRNNNALLNEAIAAAQGEAKGYLSRYDLEVLFSKTGTERDTVLLMYLKDMAVWHFIPIANPNIDIDYRETRYKDAIKWLEKIQNGKVVPVDWTLMASETTTTNSPFYMASAPKRNLRF